MIRFNRSTLTGADIDDVSRWFHAFSHGTRLLIPELLRDPAQRTSPIGGQS